MNTVIHRTVLACLLAAMAWCAVAGARADGRNNATLTHAHVQAQRSPFFPGSLALPRASSRVVAVAPQLAEPSA